MQKVSKSDPNIISDITPHEAFFEMLSWFKSDDIGFSKFYYHIEDVEEAKKIFRVALNLNFKYCLRWANTEDESPTVFYQTKDPDKTCIHGWVISLMGGMLRFGKGSQIASFFDFKVGLE